MDAAHSSTLAHAPTGSRVGAFPRSDNLVYRTHTSDFFDSRYMIRALETLEGVRGAGRDRDMVVHRDGGDLPALPVAVRGRTAPAGDEGHPLPRTADLRPSGAWRFRRWSAGSAYVLTGERVLAWLSFGVLAASALLGFTMFTRWLGGGRHARGAEQRFPMLAVLLHGAAGVHDVRPGAAHREHDRPPLNAKRGPGRPARETGGPARPATPERLPARETGAPGRPRSHRLVTAPSHVNRRSVPLDRRRPRMAGGAHRACRKENKDARSPRAMKHLHAAGGHHHLSSG